MSNHISESFDSYPIDNRGANNSKPFLNKSIIDTYMEKFKVRFSDDSIDPRMVGKIVQNLSEAQIEELADYIDRKATEHKGKAFVKLCSNVMNYKAI